jgi:hypothetical protein
MSSFTVTQPRDAIYRHDLGHGHTLVANYRLGLVEIVGGNGDYLTLLDRSDEPHDHLRDGWVTHAYVDAKASGVQAHWL